jgi:hypothetical protein
MNRQGVGRAGGVGGSRFATASPVPVHCAPCTAGSTASQIAPLNPVAAAAA